MLGMGVSRDATETAMKKIVDGLRLSWHPDLAKDEADRQFREYRLKQINAASGSHAGQAPGAPGQLTRRQAACPVADLERSQRRSSLKLAREVRPVRAE